MKRKKLLKALAGFLDGEERKKRRHHAELKRLLNELEKKEIELEEKILAARDKHKHKRLTKELEIVRAQLEKGNRALQVIEQD